MIYQPSPQRTRGNRHDDVVNRDAVRVFDLFDLFEIDAGRQVAAGAKVEDDEPVGLEVVMAADGLARIFADERGIRRLILQRDHRQAAGWKHDGEALVLKALRIRRRERCAALQRLIAIGVGGVADAEVMVGDARSKRPEPGFLRPRLDLGLLVGRLICPW